jgi:hypothetical protein
MKQRLSGLCGLCLTVGALLSPVAHALTIYTAGPANLINALGEGFKKESGIAVDVFQADTGKVMARLEAEAANPRADVVISASWESALDLDKRGWLLHWQSANAASVPAVYKGPAYVAQGLSALAIVWNPKSGTPRPTDWSDLAKPEFKDKVNMPDPASSGTALELLSGLQTAQGDKAWKLFEALKANGMAVGGANAAALNPVLQGAKAAVFGAVDYVTLGAVAKGESRRGDLPVQRHHRRRAADDDPEILEGAGGCEEIHRLRFVAPGAGAGGERLPDAGAQRCGRQAQAGQRDQGAAGGRRGRPGGTQNLAGAFLGPVRAQVSGYRQAVIPAKTGIREIQQPGSRLLPG